MSIPKSEAIKRLRELSNTEVQVESTQHVIQQYEIFRGYLGYSPRRIYYPCCAGDVSATEAFPESEVIYVDKDERYISALQKRGLKATLADVNEYNPGAVDLLILLNPDVSPNNPASFLVENGYILCNDWHGTATDLHSNKDYDFIGVIAGNHGKYSIEKDSIESYWQIMGTTGIPADSDPGGQLKQMKIDTGSLFIFRKKTLEEL